MKAEFLKARKVWEDMIDQQNAKVEILWEDQPVGSNKHYVYFIIKSDWINTRKRIVEFNGDGSWEIFT
tara:strand:- start:4577 stop:4780 length:204 start_codon:yes stop_codon:yes gene_type:complete